MAVNKQAATPQAADDLDFGGLGNDYAVGGLQPLQIFATNPYLGNAPKIKDGGFRIPLVQPNASDPSMLYQIGPQGTMKPWSPPGANPAKPYEVYASPEIEIAIVGVTPSYNVLDQRAFVEGGSKISIGKNWVHMKDGGGKSVTKTQVTWFLVFPADETLGLYRIDFQGSHTKPAEDIVKTISRLSSGIAAASKKETGKEFAAPPLFAFTVKIGVTEPQTWGKEQSGFVSPPRLILNGKFPTKLEEFKQYLTPKALRETIRDAWYQVVFDYIHSDASPHVPQQLDDEFARVAGVTMLSDGKIVSGSNVIDAPSSAPRLSAPTATQDVSKMTPQQADEKGVLDKFIESMLAGTEFTMDDVLAAYQVENITDVSATAGDIKTLLKELAG